MRAAAGGMGTDSARATWLARATRRTRIVPVCAEIASGHHARVLIGDAQRSRAVVHLSELCPPEENIGHQQFLGDNSPP